MATRRQYHQQVQPHLGNQFLEDSALLDWLQKNVPADVLRAITPDLGNDSVPVGKTRILFEKSLIQNKLYFSPLSLFPVRTCRRRLICNRSFGSACIHVVILVLREIWLASYAGYLRFCQGREC